MSSGHGFSYRPALDGLRAVAVLAVIAYHLEWPVLPGGFLGVDVFFVLSGYLITSLLLVERDARGRIELGAFWARRARRLLPAVLLLVVGISVYALTLAPPQQAQGLRGDGLSALFYVANWHLIGSGQSYFELFHSPSPLRHMWSLAIEEQFYLLWPLLVGGALALWRSRRTFALVCGAGAAASVAVMVLTYDPVDPSRSYYGTDTRAHTLLVGALLALLLHRREIGPRPGRILQGLGLAGAAGVVVAMALVHDRDRVFYHGGSLVFAVGVAALIAAAVQPGRGLLPVALGWSPLRKIGVISYGVYLWHWPVIVAMTRSRVDLDGLALDAARIAATFALAMASYFVVERPIRHGDLDRRRLLALAPAAMLLVALVLSVATAVRQEPVPAALDPSVPITAPPAPSTSATSAPHTPSTGTGPSTSSTSSPQVDRGTPASIAVVGDSVASTLVWGLEEAVADLGIRLIPSTFPGCGIASGFVVDDHGKPFDWSAQCFERVPVVLEEMIATHDPDLVVWLSTWEISDRLVGDRIVEYGTREGDETLLAAMDEARQRLTAGGAHLVVLTVAPNAASDHAPADRDAEGRVARYERLIRELAAAHPESVSVVDLAEIVCPGGAPCPDVVEGVRLRPDGGHFTEETAPWVGARVLPLILEAYRHG